MHLNFWEKEKIFEESRMYQLYKDTEMEIDKVGLFLRKKESGRNKKVH